jgi:hypothetical protein
MLNLDRDVDQLLVFAEQLATGLGGLRVVGHDGDDGSELARAHLPDVEVGDEFT